MRSQSDFRLILGVYEMLQTSKSKLLIEANTGKVERVTEKDALYPESKDYILENLLESKKNYVWGRRCKVRALLFTLVSKAK